MLTAAVLLAGTAAARVSAQVPSTPHPDTPRASHVVPRPGLTGPASARIVAGPRNLAADATGPGRGSVRDGEASGGSGGWTVTVDNDLFGPRGADDAPPDYEYTHGMRVEWTARERPSGDGRRRTRFAVGQRIYTPRRDAPEPLPGERPYAGWLSASATVEEARPGRTRSLGLEVGVTGGPSLAEPVQTALHRLAGYRTPLGWAHQLPFEPGIVLRYHDAQTFTTRGGRLAASLSPRWGAAAGNVWTGADAGLVAAAGWRALPGDGDAAGLDDGADRRTGVYLLAGVRQEWVLRNLFLEGSTFRDSHGVEKRPFVAEAEVGVGVRVRRVEVRYRAVFRGREYRTQAEPHRYGSLSLTVRPRPAR